MADKTATQTQAVTTPLPYPPSWFDRLERRVERMSIPSWVFYLGVGLFFFLVYIAIQWTVEPALAGKVSSLVTWLCFGTGYVLALMHHLNAVSAKAMDTARSTLDVTPEQFGALCFQLINLPARRALVFGIGFAIFGGFMFAMVALNMTPQMAVEQNMSLHPIFLGYFAFIFFITWFLYGTLIFHTIRQLQLVSRIYANHIRINLFALNPLYAFSWVSARTAIGWLIIVLFWSIADSSSQDNNFGAASGFSFMFLAAVTFVAPLLGIHNRLVKEKERLRSENDRRVQIVANDLYQLVDEREAQRATSVKDLLLALDIHAKTLDKISTWPWEPELLRQFVSALLLPVVLFFIQWALGRILAP